MLKNNDLLPRRGLEESAQNTSLGAAAMPVGSSDGGELEC
jgi:hypothetical protein